MEMRVATALRLFLLVFFFASGSKSALAFSAEELLSACRLIAKAEVTGDYVRFPTNYETGICWGAFGVIQKVIVQADDTGPIHGVCAPSNSKLTQLISIYVAYAEKNPQRLHADFFHVALESLGNAFPCVGRK